LFEAMAERQVTIDSQSLLLSPSFFVIATQNPVESHGAYPLPEAQLDRFTMRLSIGYPDRLFEMAMLQRNIGQPDRGSVSAGSGTAVTGGAPPVLSLAQLATIQDLVAAIPVHENLRGYVIDLCRQSRAQADLPLGVSPRGAITWMRCAQAAAYLARRAFVIPEDIQRVALPVLSLRLSPFSEKPDDFIRKLLQSIPVPV